VAEHFCARCGNAFLNDAPLDENGACSPCRLGLTAFDAAFTYGEYDGTLRKLIHLFKYHGLTPLAPELGKMMSRAMPRDTEIDLLVPMPLHWKRHWQRGFNQSRLLAKAIGKRTGIPVKSVLRRAKATPPQAGLTRAERRVNVAGAFEVRDPKPVAGRHVLIIDDVMTTGATASACAAALKRAGARRVSVLTLARADRRKGFAGLGAAAA
jgi:ComF family protein